MININDVYQTTLTLLNKEQRGYVTPEEFNYIAGVVQNEVFEGYFQKASVPEDMDSELSNIGQQYKEKLMPFISIYASDYDNGGNVGSYLPYEVSDFYRALGFHPYYAETVIPVEADRMSHSESLKVQLSPLTSPTQYNPVAIIQGEVNTFDEDNNVTGTYPGFRIIPEPVRFENHYIREPKAPNWIGTTFNGQIIPDTTNIFYQNFELHESDYGEVVGKVLGYFGLNVRDPEVQQAAGIIEQKNSAI